MMGSKDTAPSPGIAEATASDPKPWVAPELRNLAASAAELGAGASPDSEGTS